MAPKREGVLPQQCTLPPSSDSSPLVKPLRGAPDYTPHAQAEPELSGTEDIYPVSTEDATAAGLRPAAVMSSVETG